MDEVMMIPVNELKQLENYYKGQITENALLNKAGRLAAEQQLIFNDKSIPPSDAVSMTKPLANEQTKLVKRVRSGTTAPKFYQGTEEPEGSTAAGPLENLLKQLIKKETPEIKKEPVTPKIKKEPVTPKIKKEPVTPKIKKEPVTPKIKKEPVTPKIKKERKKSISTRVPRRKSSKKGALRTVLEGVASEAVKSLERPKRKRRKKTEAEKLRPSEGWESWYPLGDLRRRLEYDDED